MSPASIAASRAEGRDEAGESAQGHFVEVVGIVKASALRQRGGTRVGNTTHPGGARAASSDRSIASRGMACVDMAVMDLSSVRYLSDTPPDLAGNARCRSAAQNGRLLGR